MLKEQKKHFLYPAKLYASAQPVDVVTVLGSCVSVCLWDKEKKIGGINHFMLPLWNGKGLASPKYGNIAIIKLIEKLTALGANERRLVAKVFGGSEVIETTHGLFQIGLRNIEIAHKILNDTGIKIIKESTGSSNGRRILFNTSTGEVLMKFIKKHRFIDQTNEIIKNR